MEEQQQENSGAQDRPEEQRNYRAQDREQEQRGSKLTLIVFIILLLIVLCAFFFIKYKLPDYMMNQGKKYYEIGNYDKALKMFTNAANAKPYDDEPIYYQALTLGKLPPSYENQKLLHEIAQLDDCDQASDLAESILKSMRDQLVQQIGPNYADNILYDDRLIRWNNSKPITYTISAGNMPPEYADTVRQAFNEWQMATNGEVKFKETGSAPNINVMFVDSLPEKNTYEPELVGKTEYRISNDDMLRQADIYLKKTDANNRPYDTDKLASLALHEIGHSLGLGGHSADPIDVMNHNGDIINDNTYKKQLTERDINTVKLLYRMAPDVIDVPLNPSEYNNLIYHEVITFYPDQNYEMEIQRLLGELQNDRQNIITWVDLAINYAYKHQYARSNYILENILPLVATDLPNQQVVLYNIAANHYKMKEYDNSLRYLNMAESLKSDFDTQLLGAYIDVRKGKWEIARVKLATLLNKNPDNVDIVLKLAEVYHLKKDTKMERKVIEDFVKKNPTAAKDRRIKKYKEKSKRTFSIFGGSGK